MYTDPPQATPEQMSFTFDVGDNPQYGQTWSLNEKIEIAGYPIHITSVRAANFADLNWPDPNGSQGYEYGYDFTVSSAPNVNFNVEMDIMSAPLNCWAMDFSDNLIPNSSSIHYIPLCRDGYPKGIVKVTVSRLSVLFKNTWQTTWQP
jgi:hypothetical protein